jgi:hypothetical protein
MALTEEKILSIVAHQLTNSVGGDFDDSVSTNRKNALSTYLGNPDGKEIAGRSRVVSTDVADAIEWIMPEIVKAFTQNNDIVRFDAKFEGDEDQAEIESSYVYDILMKDNNGFVVIHQFVKDALMQKNGFVKIFYTEEDDFEFESYTGLDEASLTALAQADVEVVQMEQYDYMGIDMFNVKVKKNTKKCKVNVVCIPPEEFRVERYHNSVDLSNCRFSAHVFHKTASELVQEGYSQELVDSLPSADMLNDERASRFTSQGESVYPGDDGTLDPSQRLIEIAESCIRLDVNEDGIAELVKVTTAGGDNAIKLLDVEELLEVPFVSATAILMSHKLFGLSIYDRLRQIQEQKTSLWRQIFDNLYLQNNQRMMAVEGMVNLDDLLTSRPGRVIRVKRMDALSPLVVPPISGDAYQMMDYLDQVRSGRCGVSPEGAISDSAIGDRVGSQGVDRMMNQKEELVGLMVRVIAEVGIKPICTMIRNLVVRHQDAVVDYKHHGKWVQIDPTTWSRRPNTTIRVGTGTGNRKEQQAILDRIINIQDLILAKPGQALVNESVVYNAVDDLAKLFGMTGAGKYLIDPKSPEGQDFKKKVQESQSQAQQQQMKEQQMLLETQIKIANAEESKAQTASRNVELKSQNEHLKLQLESFQQQADNELAAVKQQLEEAKTLLATQGKSEELDFKYWNAREEHALERDRIAAQSKMARENNHE